MTIQAAIELVRNLSNDIGLADVDFSDLSLNLIVDDRSVTAEYLPEAAVFLVYGAIDAAIDTRDNRQLLRVFELAHFSVTMGGGTLTMNPQDGSVSYSLRLELAGLTAARLGEAMGEVAQNTVTFAELLSEERPVAGDPPPSELLIRV